MATKNVGSTAPQMIKDLELKCEQVKAKYAKALARVNKAIEKEAAIKEELRELSKMLDKNEKHHYRTTREWKVSNFIEWAYDFKQIKNEFKAVERQPRSAQKEVTPREVIKSIIESCGINVYSTFNDKTESCRRLKFVIPYFKPKNEAVVTKAMKKISAKFPTYTVERTFPKTPSAYFSNAIVVKINN